MAAGHAERQKEESLAAAAAWTLGPVLWERSQRSQKEESLAAAAAWPLGPVLWERSQRRWAQRPYSTYLPRMHVRTALVRAGLLLVSDTHKNRA